MPIEHVSKLPSVGTTIFTVMSQLAGEHDAINLSQGFPDFPAPAYLLERVAHHLAAGNNQYAPMTGVPELREQIARKTEDSYERQTCADTEVTVTSGATSALYAAITAFVSAGDEVIVFDPAYDSYDPAIRLAGGQAVHLPLVGDEFRIDWNRVSDAIGPATRMIILNSPHNPSGAVIGKTDIEHLIDVTRNSRIIVLSDEVYEHILFDGKRHESLSRYPALADRSLVISSFGKTFHATGWKIGYCVASAALTREFRKVHQFIQFCVVAPMQFALADFLAADSAHYRDLPDFYQQKRDYFCDLLKQTRFRFTASAGTYFQLVDYSDITKEVDTEFARRLTTELGVAAIPVSVFYAHPPNQHKLRFCFAKDETTLARAIERLCKI